MGSVDDDPSLADHASAPIENSARIYPQTATLVDLSSNFAGQLPPSSRRFSLCSPHHRRLGQPAALAALRSAAKLLSKDEARRIAANIAKLPEGACVRFGRAHIIMARRRNITPRFGIEDEILAAPIASISDIATKLEIITAGAELFDVSDDLQRLHDQIVAFRAGESLAPEPWNWHAT